MFRYDNHTQIMESKFQECGEACKCDHTCGEACGEAYNCGEPCQCDHTC